MDVGVSDDEEEEQEQERIVVIEELYARLRGGDPYARTSLETHIKKLYRDNGSLPLKTTSLLPLDLIKITDEELINVADNAIAHINRTKKGDMASKMLNSISSTVGLLGYLVGVESLDSEVSRLAEDPILRNSIIETLFGKNISPKPIHTLIFCGVEYSTSIIHKFIRDGQYSNVIRRLLRSDGTATSGTTSQIPSDVEHKAPQ